MKQAKGKESTITACGRCLTRGGGRCPLCGGPRVRMKVAAYMDLLRARNKRIRKEQREYLGR